MSSIRFLLVLVAFLVSFSAQSKVLNQSGALMAENCQNMLIFHSKMRSLGDAEYSTKEASSIGRCLGFIQGVIESVAVLEKETNQIFGSNVLRVCLPPSHTPVMYASDFVKKVMISSNGGSDFATIYLLSVLSDYSEAGLCD